jgi:hypothetical protein
VGAHHLHYLGTPVILLPESIKIQRCKADERKLLDTARDWLDKSERAPGTHATGLLDPLQEFWRQVDPRGISDRQVPIFLVGKVLHAFVLGSMAGQVDFSTTDEGSRYHEELGIWYSVDWDKGEVAEFKSSRAFKEPRDSRDLDLYLEQTLIYMVAKNVTEAKIWVLYLNLRDPVTRRTTPEFRSYQVLLPQEDLDKLKQQIIQTRVDLEKAIAAKDPTGLPLCREFKCGRGNCEWWDQCRPSGRYGSPEWEGHPDQGSEGQVSPAPKVSRPKKAKNRLRTVQLDLSVGTGIEDQGEAVSS